MDRARILLVDDEPIFVDALAQLLAEDYEVETATTGAAALAALAARSFDVVISDYQRPGASGVELLAHFARRQPECVRMRMTSHYQDPDALIAAINRGEVYRFLQKPFDFIDVRTDIQRDRLRQYYLDRIDEPAKTFKAELAAIPTRIAGIDQEIPVTMVMAEQEPKRKLFVLNRGRRPSAGRSSCRSRMARRRP